jgi:hypothetical protein
MVTLAGICLTRARRLNYGGSVSAMTRSFEFPTSASDSPRRAIICLLLVAFLLYNPFFTILSTSHDLSVKHPLSYRATVAGSELRRCTIDTTDPLIPDLSAAILHAATLFVPTHQVVLVRPSDIAGLLSQALCDSIWFRPPPFA